MAAEDPVSVGQVAAPAKITIDLATASAKSAAIPVPVGITFGSFMILTDNWGTAVIELKWSLSLAASVFVAFATPITFSSDMVADRLKSITGCRYLRWEVTTVDATADDNATLLYAFDATAV